MVIFHSYVSLPEGMADFIAITHPYLNSETLYEPTMFHTIRSRFAADSQPIRSQVYFPKYFDKNAKSLATQPCDPRGNTGNRAK